ncbi:MAG: hypothetical protein OK438_07680 [Thaumarchaeota archaeon]|nr:hypothetical protein [Nitrososphaerota archaeon]
MEEPAQGTRENEWYTPKWGPRRFRLLVGMTFVPYTLMNASYTVIGCFAAPSTNLYRAGLLALVYLLAVGISAHALDATAPNRPWGAFLTRNQLFALGFGSLLLAAGVGLYLALAFAPFLLLVGVLEIFLLLAYNLELFKGRFHTDLWFSFSWGFLPVVAGYVLQTDSFAPIGLAAGIFGFATAYVEISASRPYKEAKRTVVAGGSPYAKKFESILKGIVLSVVAVALSLVLLRTLN